MRCFSLVMSLVVLVAGSSAYGAEQVQFLVQGSKGHAFLGINQRSAEDDEAYMRRIGPGETISYRETILAKEAGDHENSGYERVPDNTVVNGYNIGRNHPHKLQICGGLALARVIGGPFAVPSEQADLLVKALGEKVTTVPEVGDVAVWYNAGTVKHFAVVAHVEKGLLSSRVWVYSKNESESTFYGPADAMPTGLHFGEVMYYHLDWDALKATRLDGHGELLSKGSAAGAVTIPADKAEPTDTGVFLEAGKPYFVVGKGVCSLWDGQEDGCDSVYRYRSPLIPGGGDKVFWGQLKLIDPTIHLCTLIQQGAGVRGAYNEDHTYEAIVIGEGKTLKAMVYDGGGYGDNHGALSVTVYEAKVR